MTLADIIAELQLRQDYNKVSTFFTDADREKYPKHLEFFAAGKSYRQRLFRAANRVGKTTGMAAEIVYHTTGNYPHWWVGHRFEGCNQWWVVGKSSETIRQILQPLLLGEVGAFGTGMIPHDALDFESLTVARKSATPITSVRVKHNSGSFSLIEFKSAEAGRQNFEGTERSIWLDEEPPMDVYIECLTRTITGNNILALTFTPLKGASDVVMTFAKDGNVNSEGEVGLGKYAVNATWEDVPHISEEAKLEMLASFPPHQRDARSRGVPSLGSGVIYPVPEEDYLVDPFEIPPSWPRLYGMDVGNNTAAVWIAINPDTTEGYIYSCYKKSREEPSLHAAAIKGRGEWIQGVIDPAARQRGQQDGRRLIEMYTDLGLHLSLAENSVETGLYTIWEHLSTGKLKIFRGLDQLMLEIRTYARDEKGHVIKANDHIMDSLRYAWMTRERAKTKLASNPTIKGGQLPPPTNW